MPRREPDDQRQTEGGWNAVQSPVHFWRGVETCWTTLRGGHGARHACGQRGDPWLPPTVPRHRSEQASPPTSRGNVSYTGSALRDFHAKITHAPSARNALTYGYRVAFLICDLGPSPSP